MTPGSTTRFRHHPGRAVAGVVVMISLTTLAAVSPWYALLVLAPTAYTVWVWRAGTDADATGVRVRALFGERRIAWSEITALARVPGDRVVATLRGGRAVALTAVTADDLPRLLASGGDRIGADGPVDNRANGRYGEPAGSG